MSRPRLLGLLLVLVTLLAFWPATQNGFVNYDDDLYVTQNSMVQRGLTWDGLVWAFGKINVSNWHPLTWLSHMVDCELFRLNAGGHHLVSLLIHAANAVLLFALWLRMTKAVWSGFFIAALFAWHPLHVESIAWVAERKDVLSTCFALLALLSYANYVQVSRDRSAPPVVFLAGSLLAFALGLMSKPMLVTLPMVMLLLDFWPLQRTQPLWPLIREKWPFFLLTAGASVLTVIAQQGEAIHQVPWALRLENVVVAYAGYLFQTVWPVNLSVFYPLPRHIPFSAVFSATVILVVISVFAWKERRRRPYLLVGWLWYLGTLVPVIGLIQVGDQAMADRYTYFPLIGIFLAATFLAKDLAGRWRFSPGWLGVLVGMVLVPCLFLTESQIRYWRDSQTLFTHALAVTQDNALAHLNLGEALQEQHRSAEAMTEYQEVLRLSPEREEAYNNIGRILNDAGKPEAALEYCQTALSLNSRSPSLHDNLGIILAELGRFDEAIGQFNGALRLDANRAQSHFQMGRTLLKQGKDLLAVRHLNQALEIEPDNYQFLIYAARVLAADENPQARDGAKALAYANKAALLAGPPQSIVLDTLAMAEAESGRFDEAVQNTQPAIELARAAGLMEDVAAMQQRLELYAKRQPWRESFRQP